MAAKDLALCLLIELSEYDDVYQKLIQPTPPDGWASLQPNPNKSEPVGVNLRASDFIISRNLGASQWGWMGLDVDYVYPRWLNSSRTARHAADSRPFPVRWNHP